MTPDDQQELRWCAAPRRAPPELDNPALLGLRFARLIAVHSRPVFADPTGRRRRLMRRAGLGVAAALGVCLLAVAVAMAGGPQAPFTHWAAPNAPAAGTGAT